MRNLSCGYNTIKDNPPFLYPFVTVSSNETEVRPHKGAESYAFTMPPNALWVTCRFTVSTNETEVRLTFGQ